MGNKLRREDEIGTSIIIYITHYTYTIHSIDILFLIVNFGLH